MRTERSDNRLAHLAKVVRFLSYIHVSLKRILKAIRAEAITSIHRREVQTSTRGKAQPPCVLGNSRKNVFSGERPVLRDTRALVEITPHYSLRLVKAKLMDRLQEVAARAEVMEPGRWKLNDCCGQGR